MAKGKVLQTVIDISGEISPTLGKSIDGIVNQLSGVNKAAVVASAAVAAIGVGAVVGVAKAGKALVQLGDSYNQAVNDLSASTGVMGDELDSMADSIKDIYAMNLGEDFADIGDSMAYAKQNTGLMGEELESLTADALRLRDTFDYDVAESTRAADALMTNFGISGGNAMNLIASGAQNGLDYSGEFLDTINEYSVQFKKVGFDAEGMFAIMQSGADGTAWTMDKVGDTVKEFSIRAIDGSDTTIAAFEAMGMNANEMMQKFAAGGETANEAFYDVLDGLLAIEDPVARDAAGVNLLGTMWEDMGVDAIQALADTRDATYDAGDALGQIAEVKYDNLGDAFEGIKRQAEVALLPLASTIASSLTDLAPVIGDLFGRMGPMIEGATEMAMPLITDFFGGLELALDDLGPMIDGVLPMLADCLGQLFAAGQQLAPIILDLIGNLLPLISTILSALIPVISSILQATMPIVSVLAQLISGLIPPLINVINFLAPIIQFLAATIANTLGHAIQFVLPIINNLTGYLSSVIDFIKNVFLGNWSAAWEAMKGIFSNSFGALAGLAKAPINAVISIVNGAIDAINSVGFDIPDWVPVVGGKKFSVDIPNIPLLATGGFTTGPSIAGEAGTEAVISFDPAYRSENLSYWARAGRMLGATGDDFSLSGTASGTTVIDMGGVTFAPNINISGKADRDNVIQAIRDEYPEFLDLLEQWLVERGLSVYA